MKAMIQEWSLNIMRWNIWLTMFKVKLFVLSIKIKRTINHLW